MAKVRAALGRAILHILVTFFVALVVVAGAVIGAGYLANGTIGTPSIVIGIVAGVIIGIIAGFIALIVELVRGVEAGVHEVERGVGDVAHGIESAAHQHDQQTR